MDAKQPVTVSSPARLHLGLMPPIGEKRFAGAGIMLAQPRTIVRIEPAEAFQVSGLRTTRVEEFARLWCFQNLPIEPGKVGHDMPPIRVAVMAAPDEHVGLGSGTQLALSIGTGMAQYFSSSHIQLCDCPESFGTAVGSAMKLGRAARTGVGSVGFGRGGLVVDWGDSLEQTNITRLEFPPDWKILLVTVPDFQGRHGTAEQVALSESAHEAQQNRDRMESLLRNELIPAVQTRRFEDFCKAAFEFGLCSGRTFQAFQAGAFCTAGVAEVVEVIRLLGWRGVVQSSWGPTLGVFFEADIDRDDVLNQIRAITPAGTKFCWTQADNKGAAVEPVGLPTFVDNTQEQFKNNFGRP